MSGDSGHFDERGAPRMVDVSGKVESERLARAGCRVCMQPETFAAVRDGRTRKGDVLQVARLAGIMAAKRTPDLIPLCHPLLLSAVEIELEPVEAVNAVDVAATVRMVGRTGVEMEAMLAAATAALTIYDMCKGMDRSITISDLRLHFKSGGKSGTFEAP